MIMLLISVPQFMVLAATSGEQGNPPFSQADDSDAASDANNGTGGAKGKDFIEDNPDAYAGVRWGKTRNYGGVRITFVDNNGNAVSGSYDFLTRGSGSAGRNAYYNGGSGNKSRFTGSYNKTKYDVMNLPKMSALVAAFNQQPGTYTTSGLPQSGDTGGNISDGFKPEQKWFKSLTDDNPSVPLEAITANVNGLIYAISQFYPLNAEQLILRLNQGCINNEEIFIIMEPLVHYFNNSGGKVEYFFGTYFDFANCYNMLPPNFLRNQSGQSSSLKLMWYDENIKASSWNGFSVLDSSYRVTSVAQVLSNDHVGWNVALDWANNRESYCHSCLWVNNKFVYDDKTYPGDLQIPAGFKNIGEFAFTDPEEGGAGCCDSLEPYLDEMPEEFKKAHEALCAPKCSILEDGRYTCLDGKECTADEYEAQCSPQDCCVLAPITPGHVEKDISNCCNDNTHSWIKEYELNDLFCYSDELKVDHYFKKCNINYYLEDDAQLNDYCEMYCTERLTLDVPGAITATSGRYFTLNTNPVGTSSPYIDGYRRCRILVDYEKWEKDYGVQVDNQVLEYNLYQENRAKELMYEDAIAHSSNESKDITVTCEAVQQTAECSYPVYNNGDNINPTYKKDTITSKSAGKQTRTFTISYTKYPFPRAYYRKWYTVEVNEDLRKLYEQYRIDPTRENHETSHDTDWSAWEITPQIQKVEEYMSSLNDQEIAGTEETSSNCNAKAISKWSCSRNTIEAESREENVVLREQQFHDAAEQANNLYNAAADEAFKLEEDIDKCDFYFETGTKGQYAGVALPGSDPKENYDMEPSMSFYYTQIYLDDIGDVAKDTSYVGFTPAFDPDACRYTIFTTPDEEIMAPSYSQIYKEGKETVHDFKNSKLEWEKTEKAYEKYLDDPYEADKMFTHDAKYRAECYWNEDDNQINTLVPSGSASAGGEFNYSSHNREYRVYLTTFDGTYETYFDIQGLGSEGRFDKYFREGTTCSGQSADTGGSELLTCTLHIQYEIVLTGYCNGVATDPEDCDPYKEGYNLFNFKTVDPENLFPSGTVDAETGKSYAYNWVNTPEGQDTMAKIQSAGASDKTYAPENLTYAFKLTSSDMAHIKEYNYERELEGGYSDFELTCSCPSKDAGSFSGACTKCKSTFLKNLADGKVRYDDKDHEVSGWTNPQKSIEAVRNGNNW